MLNNDEDTANNAIIWVANFARSKFYKLGVLKNFAKVGTKFLRTPNL